MGCEFLTKFTLFFACHANFFSAQIRVTEIRHLHERLKWARNRARMGAASVAEWLGMSTANYYRYETGELALDSVERLKNLAALFDVPYMWLCFGIGPRTIGFADALEVGRLVEIYTQLPLRVQRAVLNSTEEFHEMVLELMEQQAAQ